MSVISGILSATSENLNLPSTAVRQWTSQPLPADSVSTTHMGWLSIAQGNGIWVAIAGTDITSYVAVSTDQINWQLYPLPLYAVWTVVYYWQGRFFVGGKTSAILTSINGVDWNTCTPSITFQVSSFSSNDLGIVALLSSSNMTGLVSLYSTDGVTWINDVTSTLPIKTWTTVAYGNGIFVASAGTDYSWSSDGITWSALTTVDNFGTIAFGGGVFSTSGGYMSANGHDWTRYGIPTINTSYVYNIAYGAGLYLATTNLGVCSSLDGLTWVATITPFLGDAIIFANNMFVMLDSNATKSATSLDGITWATSTIPFSLGGAVWQIAYGNGVFVALASNNVMSSSDGLEWAAVTLPVTNGWSSVIYANNLFVAVGQSNYNFVYSSDGIVWYSTPGMNTASSIAYGNGIWVTVNGQWRTSGSATASMSRSTNGTTWEISTLPAIQGSHIVFFNGLFYAFANSGETYSSLDGISWTAKGKVAFTPWGSVVVGTSIIIVGNSRLVATLIDNIPYVVGPFSGAYLKSTVSGNLITLYTGLVITSDNGVYWRIFGGATSISVGDIVDDGSGYTLVSPTLCYNISATGVSSTISLPTPLYYSSAAYGNGRWVAIAPGGIIVHSADGVLWERTQIFTASWYSVTFANNKFVAIAGGIPSEKGATSKATANSFDGINWIYSSTCRNTKNQEIAFGNGVWVIVCYGVGTSSITVTPGNTVISYSADNGATWSTPTLPGNYILKSVIWTGSKFVAVGGPGGGLQSYDGFTWTNASTSLGSTTVKYGISVCSNNAGNVFAISSTQVSTLLPNGSGFSNVVTHSCASAVAAAASNLTLVVVGSTAGYSTRTFATNTSTARTSPAIIGGQSAVIYADSKFVTLGSAGGAYSLDEGITWTACTGLQATSWKAIIYANNKFTAISLGGFSATSVDGITWVTTATLGTCSSLAYGNGRYMGIGGGALTGASTTLTQSLDGIIFGKLLQPSTSYWSCVIGLSNGSFYTLNNAYLSSATQPSYSTDGGMNWVVKTALPSSVWRGVAENNGTFVAVGYAGIVVSTDFGLTWSSVFTGTYYAVAYGNGLFVVTGVRAVAVSSNGIKWLKFTFPGIDEAYTSIVWTLSGFIAYSTSTVIESKDGRVWIKRSTPVPLRRRAIAVNGDSVKIFPAFSLEVECSSNG